MAKAKAKEKTKDKASEKGKGRLPEGPPRLWTPVQRREAFLLSRKDVKSDFRILDKDFKEPLVPYGHFIFDYVLGLGGIARHGRVTQIHGNEGAGKTTTTLSVAAWYQKATGEPIAIFEYEPTASANYAWALGIDPEYCFFEQPTDLHKSIYRHAELMEKFGVRFFVDDSIPYMDTKYDLADLKSGKAFRSNYGSHAKGITEFYHKLHPYLLEHDAHLLIVNQTRARIDDDAENASKWSYTNREYSLPGGYEARFTPSVMIEEILESEIRPWEWGDKMPKEKEKFLLIQPKGAVLKNYPTANRVKIRVLKNKVTGKGFREAFIYVRPNFGIDENMSIRELAVSYGLIESDGGKKWYIGKSSEDAIVSYSSKTELIEDIVIKQNPEVLGKLRGMVIDRVTTDDTERFIGRLSPSELAYVTEPEAGFADEEFFEEGVPAPELPEGAVKDFKVEELE
jgi:RecA/RadA recombinase